MIKVRVNNLYVTGRYIIFDDGEELLLRSKLTIDMFEDNQYDYYTVSAEDRLSDIAALEYGGIVKDASKYWWVIADVNNITTPFDISYLIGKSIYIPRIQDVKLMVSKINE